MALTNQMMPWSGTEAVRFYLEVKMPPQHFHFHSRQIHVLSIINTLNSNPFSFKYFFTSGMKHWWNHSTKMAVTHTDYVARTHNFLFSRACRFFTLYTTPSFIIWPTAMPYSTRVNPFFHVVALMPPHLHFYECKFYWTPSSSTRA